MAEEKSYRVYVLRNRADRFYIGLSENPSKRVERSQYRGEPMDQDTRSLDTGLEERADESVSSAAARKQAQRREGRHSVLCLDGTDTKRLRFIIPPSGIGGSNPPLHPIWQHRDGFSVGIEPESFNGGGKELSGLCPEKSSRPILYRPVGEHFEEVERSQYRGEPMDQEAGSLGLWSGRASRWRSDDRLGQALP